MSDCGGGFFIKAKKEHPCIWCHTPILKGETHYQFKGLWESEWQNWRMHSECSDAHDEETEGGEIHDDTHQRGRTCNQTEEDSWKTAKEVGALIKKALDAKQLEHEHQFENLGANIRDLVVAWVEEEQARVEALEESALKPKVKVKVKA